MPWVRQSTPRQGHRPPDIGGVFRTHPRRQPAGCGDPEEELSPSMGSLPLPDSRGAGELRGAPTPVLRSISALRDCDPPSAPNRKPTSHVGQQESFIAEKPQFFGQSSHQCQSRVKSPPYKSPVSGMAAAPEGPRPGGPALPWLHSGRREPRPSPAGSSAPHRKAGRGRCQLQPTACPGSSSRSRCDAPGAAL